MPPARAARRPRRRNRAALRDEMRSVLRRLQAARPPFPRPGRAPAQVLAPREAAALLVMRRRHGLTPGELTELAVEALGRAVTHAGVKADVARVPPAYLARVWPLLGYPVEEGLPAGTTRDLYRMIRAHPGLRAAGLARLMGLTPNAVRYQLRPLQRAGWVVGAQTRPGHRHGRWWAAEEGASSEFEATLASMGPHAKRVLAFVGKRGRVSCRDVQAGLRLSPFVAWIALSRLETAGFVRRDTGVVRPGPRGDRVWFRAVRGSPGRRPGRRGRT